MCSGKRPIDTLMTDVDCGCLGNGGGSLAVNNAGWRSFLDHDTIRQSGGVAKFCERRNMSQEECQRQLSNNIERIKSQYDPDGAFTYHIVINDTPALDTIAVGPTYMEFERYVTRSYFLVRGTIADPRSGTVREWHDEWIRLNEELLDTIVAEAPSVGRFVIFV